MSGEDLRIAASKGNANDVRGILKARGNPCSCDEYGLSPLMYAVWNGHVECVKYLVCNYVGVDKDGKRCNALDLQTTRGYSALHLVAIDSPRLTCKEITWILLVGGLNRTILCEEGLTAEELARSKDHSEAIEAFDEFNSTASNETFRQKVVDMKKDLESYCFDRNLRLQVMPWDANFEVPDFIFEKQRAGAIPSQLIIHEHQIFPLIQTGQENKETVESLKCLLFTSDQAVRNQNRRAEILQKVDSNWKPVEIDSKKLYIKKKR